MMNDEQVLWKYRVFKKMRIFIELYILSFAFVLFLIFPFFIFGLMIIWHPLYFLLNRKYYHSVTFTRRKLIHKAGFFRRKHVHWYRNLRRVEIRMIEKKQWKRRGWHAGIKMKITVMSLSDNESFKINCLTNPANRNYLRLSQEEALKWQHSFEQTIRDLECKLGGIIKVVDETLEDHPEGL